MGIKGLTKLLSDEAPEAIKEMEMEGLTGRKVAVDASMAIYQFLVSDDDIGLTKIDGREVSIMRDGMESLSEKGSPSTHKHHTDRVMMKITIDGGCCF